MNTSDLPLTSVHNPLVKSVRQALVRGRLTEDGLLAGEGPHLLEEALRSNLTIAEILVEASVSDRYRHLTQAAGCRVSYVAARTMEQLAATENSQGIVFLTYPPRWTWDDLHAERTLIVVLDGLQDPGNCGAIIRSAEAFGASGVVLATGGTQWTNAKLLRASSGSAFRLPCLSGVARSEIRRRFQGLSLFSLAAEAAKSIQKAELSGPCALVIGSEGAGVSAELAAVSQPVSIPMQKVESLNAAIACSIALFEASRQRGMQ